MAASSRRVVRTPKRARTVPPPAELSAAEKLIALTAAASMVDEPDKMFRSDGLGLVGRREAWQSDAWAAVDRVGELHYFVTWRANSCSRASLVASEIDPDTGMPTGGIADDDPQGQRVAEYVRAIAGGPSGQSQLVKRAVECLTVAGEFWLAVLQRPAPRPGAEPVTLWLALSRDEIEPARAGGVTKLRLPDGKKHPLDPEVDSLVRVWNPHPRVASEPDSLIRSCLDPLREIVRTTKTIAAAQNNRLATAGLLAIPTEADLPGAGAPVAAGKPDGSPPAPAQPATSQSIQKMLVDLASHNLENENATSSVVPLVLKVPADYVDKIKLVELGGDIPAEFAALRDNAIQRLARGLDVSQERIMGMGSSSHWNSWQIADEDVQLHVVPPLSTLCSALYEFILAPLLADEGVDVERYTLHYDTTRLTQDPDKSDEAKVAAEAGVLRIAAQLRYLGLSEDSGYDLTTDEGRADWAREVIIRDPSMLKALQPLVPELAGIELPDVAPAPAQQQPGLQAVGDGQREPQLEPDPQERTTGVGIAASGATLRAVRKAR